MTSGTGLRLQLSGGGQPGHPTTIDLELTMTDRYRTAWRSGRQRAAVLSAELTRRAPLLGEYAAENAKLHRWHDEDRTALAEMRGTIERLRAELEAARKVEASDTERLTHLEGESARLRDQQPAAPSASADADLRDRIRRAVCEAEGFGWDTDMLEPDEYGEVADAVLAVLPEPRRPFDVQAGLQRLADDLERGETGDGRAAQLFVPPAADGLPLAALDSATDGASALDAWARDPHGRNFLAHALVKLARDGWLRAQPGEGFEPVRDDRETPEREDPTELRRMADETRQACVCGESDARATVHRSDGPCYAVEARQADEAGEGMPLLFWDEPAGVTYEDGRITAWISRAVNLAQSLPAGQLILQAEAARTLRRALTTALNDADEAQQAGEDR